MKFSTILFSITIALSGTTAFASGGGGGGGFGGGGGSYSQPQRQVDETYEVGKAIFNGRQSGVASISYCVASGDVKLPVKSKSLSDYKKTTYDNLSQNLYNCDKPDTLIATELSNDNLLYVLYYLNKRYRLKLSSS